MTTARSHFELLDNATVVAFLTAIADGTIPLAKLAALTASRIVASNASGVLTTNAAGTANRMTYWDGAGSLGVNAAITTGKLVVSDGSGLLTANANTMTGSRVLATHSGNGHPESTSVTTTTLGYLDATSSIQTQLNGVHGYSWISSATASASASITFTGLTTYGGYRVVIHDVQPATDNVQFIWRASTDNGSSYASTASYNWAAAAVGSAATFVGAAGSGDTSFRLAAAMGNADNSEAGSFIFDIVHRGSGSSVSRVMSQGTYRSATPDTVFIHSGGTYNVGDDVDAMQFLMSSGNIARGTFHLYGLRES